MNDKNEQIVNRDDLGLGDRLLLHILTNLGTDYEQVVLEAATVSQVVSLGNRIVMSWQRSYLNHLDKLDGQDHHVHGYRYARSISTATQMVITVLADLGPDHLFPKAMISEAAIAAVTELVVSEGFAQAAARFNQVANAAHLLLKLELAALADEPGEQA